MKSYRLLLLVVGFIFLSTTASMATNGLFTTLAFPNRNTNPNNFDQYAPFLMRQGWVNSMQAWYICTDSSDQQLACSTTAPSTALCIPWVEFANGINFAPRLISAAGHVPIMYVITNVNQGPVFTTVPGAADYSGIWQVVYVTFKPGVMPFCVNNANPYNPMTNPHGLPGTDLATLTDTNAAGLPIIVKYPIVAIGPLGGPWYPPAVAGTYRIPQGKVMQDYTRTKIIWLPFWNAYCRNSITKAVSVRQFIVPDVYDPLPTTSPTGNLLVKLGANNAPGLAAFPPSDEQAFYWQLGPQPINQYPILQACPENEFFSTGPQSPCRNSNYNYTPVDFIVAAQRNVPPLAPYTVINNEPVLLQFAATGCLTLTPTGQIIDAPVLPTVDSSVTNPPVPPTYY